MEGKKSAQSWTIPDEFGEAIKDEIPKQERDPEKQHVNAPGQGRKPMSARKALEGIFYVLRTGYFALVQFACAVIVRRKLIPVHR